MKFLHGIPHNKYIWIMSANIIRGFLGTTLEARFGGNVWQEVGFT
jgi:hypothetical protein